ncbi:fatty acid desaturase [Hyphococcus sp.]|jgi:beta-carotene hydroxylase|uniref:fatty acid desaturase n=1 Tax=Hyphococcus sp. TaxID=2038636 RepID=UPI003D0AD994
MSVTETTKSEFKDRAMRGEAKVVAFDNIRSLKSMQRCAEAEVGGVAWPTVFLSISAILAFTTIIGLTISGALNIWVAAVINLPVYFVLYTGLHEAAHRNYHGRDKSKRWINHLFGLVIGWIMFYPYSMHDYIHLTHHANTNDFEKDPDAWMRGNTFWVVFARAATLPWRYWSFTIGAKMKEPDGAKFFAKILLQITPTLAGVTLLVVLGYWQVALIAWFGSLVAAVGILGVCFDWIVHHPHGDTTLLGGTRVFAARTGWKRHALKAALLGQNYHLIHHIYPRTPFYRYDRVFERSEDFLRSQGVRIIDVS